MRIAILSDIHGNHAALKEVLADVERHQVDELICLGDTVGYGPYANECCELVRKHAKHCILGNHDAAVAGRMDCSYYYNAAREAIEYHQTILSPENMQWLRGLNYQEIDGDQAYCHGSPVDLEQFEYILDVEQAGRCLDIWHSLQPLTFIGHSHLCKSFALTKERVYEVVKTDFEIRPEFRYIISVGSVGQPRDHDPRACWTLLDTNKRNFSFHRSAYDIEKTAKAIFDQPELADNFGKRLFEGM